MKWLNKGDIWNIKKSVDISYIYVKKRLFISMYIYIWDRLGMIGWQLWWIIVRQRYLDGLLSGISIMKSADIGLVVGTAIWMKVERRSSGLVGQQCGWRSSE